MAGLRAISGQDEMLGTLVPVISSGKQALDAVMMGRMVAESVMLIEREEVAGPDDYPTDPAFKKWAHEEGSLYLGDQKVKVTRPRLRHVEQGVTLQSYTQLRTWGVLRGTAGEDSPRRDGPEVCRDCPQAAGAFGGRPLPSPASRWT
jgi:hypothetical protein